MLFIKLYLTAFLSFMMIDLLWLGVIASHFYREQIGFLMTDDIRWGAAILFYALYILGLVIFVIHPAIEKASWSHALIYGALFGLVCYATYDLTNLATLKNWPIKLSIVDLAWGTFVTGATAMITTLIGNHWQRFFI